MPDMLVKLYDLPALLPALDVVARHGIEIRRALVLDKPAALAFARSAFPAWATELEAAFWRQPVSCFVAQREQSLLGFACYDVTCANFFGPTAVTESERGRGIGRALLLAALHAQKAQGYAYAIIGGVGPAEYYANAVGAVLIDGSSPGIYARRLQLAHGEGAV